MNNDSTTTTPMKGCKEHFTLRQDGIQHIPRDDMKTQLVFLGQVRHLPLKV
jgi:hypothetical protein